MALDDLLSYIRSNNYLYSLTVLVLFYVLSKLVVFSSQRVILKLTKKTKTNIDDSIVKKTNKPISIILFLIGIKIALLRLGIPEKILSAIENTITALIIAVITYITIIVVDVIIDNWGKKVAEKTPTKFDDELVPLFHRFSRIFIVLLGLLFILPVWGIAIGPLLTSLGIAGVAIAFALQSTLGNIFGGISIILDKSVKVGDKIKIDNDTMGTVLDVGLRSTKIKTWDNEVVTIPNGKLADSKILNFFQPDPSVRVVIKFGVEYGSDTEKVRRVVLKTLAKLPGVLKKPAPKILMTDMGDFALNFQALFWIEDFDLIFEIKPLTTEKIYNALTQEGISIPFPTRTVYLKK